MNIFWFYEFDEDTGLFCVFHSESSRAYESYASEDEAAERIRVLKGHRSI